MTNGADDINIPPAFSGPAQLVLFTRYDDPRTSGWEHKWLTTWQVHQSFPWFPEAELRIHKHFRALLTDAFTELEKAGLHTEIKSCHNCHKILNLHNSPVLSVHSWGAAIDLNADDNPMGSMGKWSDEFIRIMTRNGIFCGQSWTGNKEPMHFAMVDGE